MQLHKGAIIAVLFSSIAFADTGKESGLYIGGSVGFLSSKSHATIIEPFTFTKDPDNTEKINSLGFNLGYRLSANHRLYYEYRAFNRKIFNKKNDVSLSNIGYAFTPKIGNHWRAVISGFIGTMGIKDDFKKDVSAR